MFTIEFNDLGKVAPAGRLDAAQAGVAQAFRDFDKLFDISLLQKRLQALPTFSATACSYG
jgi:hypothetical protein